MCDMMQVMTLSVTPSFSWPYPYTVRSLKDIASPTDQGKDGVTVEQRLKGRMGGIVDSVKRCAKLCDNYQKRHTAGARCFLWSSI